MYVMRFMLLSVGLLLLTACPKDEEASNPTESAANNTTFTVGTDAATKKPSVSIKGGDDGVGTRRFSKDTVYILENLVFVNAGQTLTIEAGTIIKG